MLSWCLRSAAQRCSTTVRLTSESRSARRHDACEMQAILCTSYEVRYRSIQIGNDLFARRNTERRCAFTGMDSKALGVYSIALRRGCGDSRPRAAVVAVVSLRYKASGWIRRAELHFLESFHA